MTIKYNFTCVDKKEECVPGNILWEELILKSYSVLDIFISVSFLYPKYKKFIHLVYFHFAFASGIFWIYVHYQENLICLLIL